MGVARARGCFKDVKPIPHLGPKTLTSYPQHSTYVQTNIAFEIAK